MTREECLDWLYRLRGEIYVYIQPKEWLIPMNNALDMAIKALEHPEQNVIAVVPCGDAISRQAAIDAIWDGVNMDIYTREVKECLEKLPSVSVAEKVGRWIETEVMQSGYKETWITCNNCGYDTALFIPKRYCPNCGARMEGQE